MYSFQTNVTSLISQDNLRVNSEFQGKTIARLTSGLRITSSGDDAAGLAVANGYRANITELSQGVRNGNDGISTLQIVDGGLNNISKILDRLKTLATQSASGTFTGSRTTLNNEYQTLVTEITRQAANVGLNAGGVNNTNIGVYIGGGNNQTNSQALVDLSGTANQVDAVGLGLAATNIAGNVGAVQISTSANLLSGGPFLAGNESQSFRINLSNGTSSTITLNGGASGLSGDQVISSLNTQLASAGIVASKDPTNGKLSLTGSTAFSVETLAASGGTAIATANTQVNSNLYTYTTGAVTAAAGGGSQVFTITPAAGSVVTVTLNSGDSAAVIKAKFNTGLATSGISVVEDSSGALSFQSNASFSIARGVDASTGGLGGFANNTSATVTPPQSGGSPTASALAAITALGTAIQRLGNVQGKVGTAQNSLGYAIALAQSQITNYSAAESRIRDADVASEAANLTKAQVLQQASVAAMSQANSAPQGLLKLFQG